ncbi:MAG: FGLLP motif-containing membrane protein [Candidatus Limnocylindrales bacterium]
MRVIAWAALLFAVLALVASPVLAAEQSITSAGPLSRIIVSDTLSCQVAHRDDDQFEFYPSGSEIGNCGTFVALGGAVYGPEGGAPNSAFWSAVSQSPVAGTGTGGDPLRVVTVVEIAAAALRIQQTDSYVVGSQSYRTDIEISNLGNALQTGVVYRAGDCYLQGDDAGFVRVDGGAPACIVDPQLGRRIEQWTPITPGSHYFAGGYSEVWSLISGQENFPDRCECAAQFTFDNGAGLSWPLNLAPGLSVVYSHETFFSPVGRGPVQQSFTESVPTSISLDPVVVATSLAIAAGVIVLVPFPSALFNSTLEENYDEVMAGIGRLRARLSRIWASFLAWLRGQVAQQRARRAAASAQSSVVPAETVGTPAEPEQPVEPMVPLEPIAAPPAEVAPGDPTASNGAAAKADPWRTPLGIAGFIVATALLYAFLDPTFGFSVNSLATFAGLTLGLFVVLLAYGLPLMLVARTRQLPLTVRALPATILVGVACVLISRFVNFQPGYLYGLVIGFFFAAGIPRDQEGRAEAIAAASSLLVAFLAWIALAFLRAGAADNPGDLTTAMLTAATVTIVVAGLENAVFAMLPLRFLPGAAVYAWDRRVWIVLLGLGIFGFAHVLLNPSAGYLADTTRTSFFTLIALLVGFAVASVLFWGWFRFRPKKQAPA